MSSKLPFLKFFVSDWLSDEKLRLVSLPARGLWIDMLCLMAKADRRGYLELTRAIPMPPEMLARLAGISVSECSALLDELASVSVFSRDGSGVIYSRRLVRDSEFRLKCSEAGVKGGGNPTLSHTFKGAGKGSAKVEPKVYPKPQKLEAEADISCPPPPAERARDVLFDALAYAEGSNPRELTKDGGGRIGAALAQIKKVCPDLSISEITKRAKEYRRAMPPGSKLTANALAVNWAKLSGKAVHAPAEKEEQPPEGWRTVLEEMFPGNAVNADARPWAQLMSETKVQVLARLKGVAA